MLQTVSVTALKMQSYLVTEKNYKRLSSDQKSFEWLVYSLDRAIRDKGRTWTIIEPIEVELTNTAQHSRPKITLNLFYFTLSRSL